MRLGLVGPAEGDALAFREAAEFLLGDAGCDRVIYLGRDDVAEQAAALWLRELGGEHGLAFEERAAALALDGTPEALAALLSADAHARRIPDIISVPKDHGRAVEMLDDRILLFVHDKAVLDEEDIVNASVIVYGQSREMLLKRFGPRCFFTPGPLRDQRVGVLEREADGRVALATYEPSGLPLSRELLSAQGAKMTVAT